MSLGERIKKLRKEKGLTQLQLAEKANMSRTYVADVERNRYNPSIETLKSIADALNVDPADLLSENKLPYYKLNDKDERDIAKRLESVMESLESEDSLAFLGGEMDEETRNLLKIALEHGMRIATETAKRKYTPKKYRK